MKHCGTQPLETKRLLLRRFVLGDADAMFRNWAADPEVTKYLTWPVHTSPDVSSAVLDDWVSSYARADFYQWAIVFKENGSEPIGSISAVKLDADLSIVQIGYCLGRAWWRRGIMSEALKAVMSYLTENEGISCVTAWCAAENIGSRRAVEKAGMKLVRTEEGGLMVGDCVYDKLVFEYVRPLG